jgi:predicted dehydrogenase
VIRTGIIGLGPQGKRVAAAIRSLPGFELSGVCDLREESLADPELLPSVVKARDARALFSQCAPDLLCITTNGPSHRALVAQAIDAGVRRIMVEKPMACSVAEAKSMSALAAEHGVRLAVNQSRRHDPFYRWLRDEIRAGAFGVPRAAWVQRPGIGLGCLATHSFDLVAFLFDREVTRVTAWVDPFVGPNPRGEKFVDPGGLVVLELSAGVRAVIAQIEDGAGPTSVELDFTAARVRIDEKSGACEIVARDLSVRPGPDRPAVFHTVNPPAGLLAKPNITEMTKKLLVALAGDGEIECDARAGEHAIEVLVAAHVSAKKGNQPIALPLREKEEIELWLPVT